MWVSRIIGFFIALILCAVKWSSRYRVCNEHFRFEAEAMNNGEPPVFAVLHAHQMSLITFNFYRSFGVITSQSKDGEIAATVLRLFSMKAIRGSSSKGGQQAMEAAITHVKDGNALGITVDGPRGPRGKVKRGVCEVARKTGKPVVPAVAIASNRKELRSWDRFHIPLPFSRITIIFGKAIEVPEQADEQTVFHYCSKVEQALDELERNSGCQ